MQNSPSLFNCLLFSENTSIIDFLLRTKYASDKLSFSSYAKFNAFFQIAIFLFFAQRNHYTETLYNFIYVIITYIYVTEFI